ncbi:hypothetical protein [Streptomyces sp. NPDC127103]|uniref:hypothetical protein n=1 Tax=Streptomyces sp. NPDC127103 TaxID=3347139 RepID=UPI00365D4CA2
MQQRLTLVVASQCDALPPLSFINELSMGLYGVLTDATRGGCQPAASGLLIDPDREEALEQIDAAFRQANDLGALLILAFLGHGIAVDEDFYFLAKDSEGSGSYRKDIHLSQSLKENLRTNGSIDGLAVLLDTCQSGIGAQQASKWREVGLGAHLRRYEILTAAADQPAFNGIFTRSITSILTSGVPTAGAHLRAADLRAPLQSACAGQRPQHIAHDGGVWAAKNDKGIWFSHNVAADSKVDGEAIEAAVDIQDRLKQLPGRDRGRLFSLWKEAPSEVGEVICSLTSMEANPVSTLEGWREDPPAWLSSAPLAALLTTAILASSYGIKKFPAKLYEASIELDESSGSLWTQAAFCHFVDDDKQAAQSVAERAPFDVSSRTPSLRAVKALLEENWDALQGELEGWGPIEPEERGIWLTLKYQHIFNSPGEKSISIGMLNAALDTTEEVLREEWLPGIALQKARFLVEKARRSGSLRRLSDLNEATDLAIRARDERRAWSGDSGEAVAVACRALLESGDVKRVMRYGTCSDTGEALESEASLAEVRECVALAQLAQGVPEEAARLAESITHPYNRARILALASRRSGKESEELWREALAAATDEQEEVVALHGLARCGVSDLPELAKYAADHPKMVAEIKAVAEISSGRTGAALRTLQLNARGSESAAVSLAQAYVSIGDADSAVAVYENAAADFGDPSYSFEAVELILREGQEDRALEKVQSLLASVPLLWPGRVQAMRLAVDLCLKKGDFDGSQGFLRSLLEDDPANASMRWTLIQLLLQREEMEAAWREFIAHPAPLEASTSAEASAWVFLNVEFNEDAEGVISGCLRLMRKFPDSEVVAAQVCTAVLKPKYESSELPESLFGEIQKAHESFFIRWPDSPYLKRMEATDPEAVVMQMNDMVRVDDEEAKRRNRITAALFLGQLPLGFLSTYARRPYAQALITRSAGVITAWGHDPQDNVACAIRAQHADGQSVVYDLSAAVVWNELPAHIKDPVLNFFRSAITAEPVLKDVKEAVPYLDPRSTSTWGWDDVNNTGRFYDISKELAEERARDVKSILDFVLGGAVRARPSLRILPGLPEPAGAAWVSPVELAKNLDLTLWVDDSALRAVARSAGVATVSTPAILQTLWERGAISAGDYEESVRSLISGYVGDAPLSLPRLLEMAREEEFQDASISAVVSRPATWINVRDGLRLLEGILKGVTVKNPSMLPLWVARAVNGAAYASSSDSVARHDMVARIIAVSLQVTGAQGAAAKEVFDAARGTLAACKAECAVIDPVERGLLILRDAMLKILPSAIANRYIMGIVSELDDDDRRAILAALLR